MKGIPLCGIFDKIEIRQDSGGDKETVTCRESNRIMMYDYKCEPRKKGILHFTR